MKRNLSPGKLHAPGMRSGENPDKKQRTATSNTFPSPRAMPLQLINQDSADPADSADPLSFDREATNSVTEEETAALKSEYSFTHEKVNELGQEKLSDLCDRCRQIDFDNIFSQQNIKQGGDPILWFYSEHKLLNNPGCAFCQAMQFIHPSLDTLPEEQKRTSPLVVATLQNGEHPESNLMMKRIRYLHVPPKWNKERASAVGATVQDNAIQENEWVAAEEGICLTFGYHLEPPSTHHTIHRWTKQYVELRNASHHDHDIIHELVGYLAEKRTIESDNSALPAASIKPRVNFGMVKERLKECREEHQECRRKRGGKTRGVPGMRLIDCRTRTIGPAPEGDVSYAALSYVWGTSTDVQDSYDTLPENLPKTISDAILVTQELGMHYLWVDRYCIRQGEPQTREEKDEKHGQIARMHCIYGRASMTIIAAAGHGPGHGLPGVSTERQPPPVVRLPHRTLFATLPDPKFLVDTSAWAKRGWTFQEGLLARRRLVFTDQQVYFECGETGDAEAWEESHEEDMFYFFDVNRNTPLYPYFALGNGGGETIWPRIEQYIKLTLGNPQQDILNAILGVLTHYEGISSMRHIAGLPLSPWTSPDISWAEEFADALSWECDEPGKRRSGFPTWSWTGWTCKGLERNQRVNRIQPDRVRAWGISIERPAGDLTDLCDVVPLLEGRHDLSQVKSIHVSAPSLEAEIVLMNGIPEDQRYWCENQIWDGDGFDNNREMLGVRYSRVETVSFLNLTDSSLLEVPNGKIQCFAIFMDEDRPEIPNDQLGKVGNTPVHESRHHATALILIEKEDGCQKIGVSGIDREVLRRRGSKVREFRLI